MDAARIWSRINPRNEHLCLARNVSPLPVTAYEHSGGLRSVSGGRGGGKKKFRDDGESWSGEGDSVDAGGGEVVDVVVAWTGTVAVPRVPTPTKGVAWGYGCR